MAVALKGLIFHASGKPDINLLEIFDRQLSGLGGIKRKPQIRRKGIAKGDIAAHPSGHSIEEKIKLPDMGTLEREVSQTVHVNNIHILVVQTDTRGPSLPIANRGPQPVPHAHTDRQIFIPGVRIDKRKSV